MKEVIIPSFSNYLIIQIKERRIGNCIPNSFRLTQVRLNEIKNVSNSKNNRFRIL